MRNCIVLGCARSGTSMLAGVLADNGYDPGVMAFSPSISNPKGYFEDLSTVRVNNRLLQALWPSVETTDVHTLPRTVWMSGRDPVKEVAGQPILSRDMADISELFLSVLPTNQYIRDPVSTHNALKDDMTSALSNESGDRPFVRKDPRFCYTLDAWRPQFDDSTAFICIFRDPGVSANSILKHIEGGPLWRDLGFTYGGAMSLWEQSYAHVLQRHRYAGDWMFVHYDQILDGSALPSLARHLDIESPLVSGFVEPALRRSATGPVSTKAMSLYEELCTLAQYPTKEPTIDNPEGLTLP